MATATLLSALSTPLLLSFAMTSSTSAAFRHSILRSTPLPTEATPSHIRSASAAWIQTLGSRSFPPASIYNNAGTLVAGDILINTTTAGFQFTPTLVGLSDGGFVATWKDHSADVVRGQRFDALGNKIGVEYVVKTGLPGDSPDSALL